MRMMKEYPKKKIYLQRKDKQLFKLLVLMYSIIMEHQTIINLLGNTPNQQIKFRTKTWAEINDEERGRYNTNTQIKFKTSVLRSSLCDCSDAYILVTGTVTVVKLAAGILNNGMQVVFKNCAPFANCISKINNTQIDNAKYIDVVMPIYNIIEYCDNY